jgi:hypothetical protein
VTELELAVEEGLGGGTLERPGEPGSEESVEGLIGALIEWSGW